MCKWARRAIGMSVLIVACLQQFAADAEGQSVSSGPTTETRLELNTEAVAPLRFIAAHGRRALIDGYAADSLEIWAYPFQILSDYRVSFLPQGSATPVNCQQILRRITYEPNSITRIYIGSDFIVHEKLFVPLDKPGAILTYSVTSTRPVEIQIHAVPVLNLMWPAALGGQSANWNPSLSAYVLSEPAEGFSAVFGSPETVAHDEVGNRTTQDRNDAGLGLTMHPDKDGVARVFVGLNSAHTSDTGLLYRQLIRDRQSLESESDAHVREVKNSMLSVETPDQEVNQAFASSEMMLDQAWVCNPDLGCGFVAGYGPSRGNRRPQYDWFFAGDGLIATEASLAANDIDRARQELEFILRYQDKHSGMIWHELSQSAGLIDWVGKYPYMYVHVDTTFQFLATVGRYISASGDIPFARNHWSAIEAAYHYCNSIIDPSSGLPRIPADKEGGNEQDRMSDDLGLSASWVEASAAVARIATLTGHAAIAEESATASGRARTSIPRRYWSPEQSFWISGHTQSGKEMLQRRSGPSEALTMHLFDLQQSEHLLNELASSAFQTDWGTRGVGEGSPGFNPESYASGSVSAVTTASLASAYWGEHRPATALGIWQGLLPWFSLDSLGRMHEVLAGNYYHPQVESVPEQTWSSAAFVEATVRGLLGLEVDPINRHILFAPHLPADWNHLSVSQMKFSGGSIALALHRSPESLTLDLQNSGDTFKLEFAPELPLGASLGSASFNRQAVAAKFQSFPQETVANVTIDVPHGKSELLIEFHGGVLVKVENSKPLLGSAGSGIRIIDCHVERNTLSITADVRADAQSRIGLQTRWQVDHAENATVKTAAADAYDVILMSDPATSATYQRITARVYFKP
jgi:glycogen debranching enzyme